MPGAGSGALITRTPAKDSAIARVQSVEPSSTTVIWKSIRSWRSSDSSQRPMQSCSLRAGTTIWTEAIAGDVFIRIGLLYGCEPAAFSICGHNDPVLGRVQSRPYAAYDRLRRPGFYGQAQDHYGRK